jgi:uncharacterized protein
VVTVGKEFLLLFAVLFLPGMIAQSGVVDGGGFDDLFFHAQLLATAIPQIMLVVAFSELRREGSAGRFGWRRPRASDAVPATAGLLGIWAIVGLLSFVMSLLGGAEGMEPAVDWSFERRELLPLVLVSTLAIGYREEIFYRAYVADRADEIGTNPRIALAGAALLFAAGHLYQGLAGFIVSLAIGLLLAEVYVRTRSLHGIAIAHGLYNFVVLVGSTSA